MGVPRDPEINAAEVEVPGGVRATRAGAASLVYLAEQVTEVFAFARRI